MVFRRQNFLLIAALLLLTMGPARGAHAQTLSAPSLPAAQEAAQTPPVEKDAKPVKDKRPANVLFEEARSYVDKTFAEFTKQKIPYNQKLEAKTKQEQKDLAAKYAAVLEARKSLKDADVYYLGMLHYTAGNGDAALDAMRRYLAGEASGENAQLARAVVVLYTIEKILFRRPSALSRLMRKTNRRI